MGFCSSETRCCSDFVELPQLVEAEEDIVKSLVDLSLPFIGVPSMYVTLHGSAVTTVGILRLVATEKLPKSVEAGEEEKENAPEPLKVGSIGNSVQLSYNRLLICNVWLWWYRVSMLRRLWYPLGPTVLVTRTR